MNEIQEQIINKTDLHFFRYCQEQFGINRGVYNTIEQWFYNKEVQEIAYRRKFVLRFLKHVYGDEKGSGKFLDEGLVSRLHKFWKKE
ncbi:hypothetical protein [Peribacillus huizhouensis]|uniref:Uncharacterized protein n=1 Tax=Peribacillus huizhouensis TaxID=1501239 RepID=A0ABR6CU05_9BACI|nr:hypothetical protein [Peribacillus huizhouensis]MBA9028518.1 hypothetical protein [Peribacillus huizhouensis]